MADTPITVLALSGSLRKGSYNTMLLHAAKEIAPAAMSIDIYDLAPIPMYNDDVRLGPGYPPEVQAFRDAIAAHDAVLFASPEYNFSVSGVLKNAIDWASRAPNMPFDGKTGAVLGASAGALGTARSQRDLRWIMSGLNMYMVNLPHVYVGGAAQKFADGKLTDQASRDFIKQLLDNLRDLTIKFKK
ncbi:MAG TPA: NAD(P)H-dependent oxidoreductase [Stellaceae bacterium]|jgi:chromate reductase|nr:NAD(P)H-dependent oxidoreductase [Stellaceae bacterium]